MKVLFDDVGENINDVMFDEMMEACDTDGDGKLSFLDFCESYKYYWMQSLFFIYENK